MTDTLPVLCDLFDPSRSSEFAVPSRILQSLAERTPVRISTFLRTTNNAAISAWIDESGLADWMSYDLYPFRFARPDGSHRSKLHLVLDIAIRQMAFLRQTSACRIVAKIGMVHFVFNLLPVIFRRGDIIIGPVSGFEIFPLRRAWRYLTLRRALYYAVFNLSTAILRWVFKAAVRLRKRSIILCATASDSRYLLKNNAKAQHRVHVVSEVTLPSADLVVSPDRNHIVWSGAIIERKAPLLALEALVLALRDRPAAHATMLGDGPLMPRLRDAHADLPPDIRNRITIAGAVPLGMSQHMIASAGMLLVTSWREANSFVVYEALSYGVPVISMPLSGMRKLVGQFGRLIAFAPPISTALADAIIDVLDNTDAYRTRAAKAIAYLPRKDSEDMANAWAAAGLA